MACISAAPPSQLNLTSRPSLIQRTALPSSIAGIHFHSITSPFPSFRYRKNIRGLELRQRSFSITATNSSNKNSIKVENGSSKATYDAQGPPFLTILAGIFIFSLVLWIVSSAVTSLIGLIVKLISAK